MKKILFSLAAVAALLGMVSCSTESVEVPVITDLGITANPVDCQVYSRGDSIYFHYRITGHEELGSYNLEIHNNFDHHTHGTQGQTCALDAKKEPQKNAFYYNQDFVIPRGNKDYDAHQSIYIPANAQPGDYHFVIRATNSQGGQGIRAMAIKIK